MKILSRKFYKASYGEKREKIGEFFTDSLFSS